MNGKRIALVALIPLFVVGLSVYSFAEASPSKIAVLSPDQLRASDDSPKIPPGLYKRIIADTTSPEDISDFEEKGCQVVHNLNDATALKCPTSVIPSLNNVREDRLFKIHDQVRGNFPINADDVEADLGYDGSGKKVAILDTGVDASNQELSDSVIKTKNFIKGLPPHDNDGHGTHVSGIVTGNGIATINNSFGFVSPNWAKGSAPNADIIVGKVCWTLGCYESAIAKGIEWAVAQNADVLSMSLGSNELFSGSCDGDFLAQKANWAVSQGLVVVVSSGNDYSTNGMSSPACGTDVISVGATYAANNMNTVAAFSNSASGLTLVAPGVDILSTYSCRAAGDCSSNWYAWISGTSMAAPRVAGVAALVLDADPNLTPAQVKTALCEGAIDATNPDRDGCGMVNALAAVQYVLGSQSPPPPPSNNPPVAADITPPAFAEDTESIITLSYTDEENDLATAATLSAPNNVSITTAASCDVLGVCTVGVTGTPLGFSGAASFSYTVTAGGQVSNVATATLTITAGNGAPDVVEVTKADFNIRKNNLHVQATSTSTDPLTFLTVYDEFGGIIDQMNDKGGGSYQLRINYDPGATITVISSSGGSVTDHPVNRR